MSSGEIDVNAVASASGSSASTRKCGEHAAGCRPAIVRNGPAAAGSTAPAGIRRVRKATAPAQRARRMSGTARSRRPENAADSDLINAFITAKASVAAILSPMPVVTEFAFSLNTARRIAVVAQRGCVLAQ